MITTCRSTPRALTSAICQTQNYIYWMEGTGYLKRTLMRWSHWYGDF